MRYSIRTVTPAAQPLLSLEQAKQHLRVDFDDDDTLIAAYAAAAQDLVERYTSQILMPRTLEIAFVSFPCPGGAIVIPRDPITEISAIAYTGTDGATVALDEADWRWSESAPDQVLAAVNTSWPSAAREAGSLRVTFVAGYEEGLCPPMLIEAVRRQTAFLYGNRGDVAEPDGADGLAPGVKALCAPFRRVLL